VQGSMRVLGVRPPELSHEDASGEVYHQSFCPGNMAKVRQRTMSTDLCSLQRVVFCCRAFQPWHHNGVNFLRCFVVGTMSTARNDM
jgi:hypothetical protein